MSALADLVATLRQGRGLAHKTDIAAVLAALPDGATLGDDCAAIPDGDGYLLFAIEGFLNELVASEPWFAGWCGIMVNLSDIYAMGGRPIAVVDALWSDGEAAGLEVLAGLAAASRAYGVPIVGGHSNSRNDRGQLAVAVLGRANRLLSGFVARPGDRLLLAIDLRGRYREPNPYWDASTDAPPARLRGDLELLPAIAEAGLCGAGKDISMAGIVGTALMLLECSGLGGVIEVAAIPRPGGVPLTRWLASFPSFGFLLSVAEAHVEAVTVQFAGRGIACAAIGVADASGVLRLRDGTEEIPFWDLGMTPLTGRRAAGGERV